MTFLASAIFVAGYAALWPVIGFQAAGLIIPVYLAASWYFRLPGALLAWAGGALLTWGLSTVGAPPVDRFLLFLGLMVAAGFGWLRYLYGELAARGAEIAASEARFRRLSEASFEGLVITEGERVVEANETMAHMLRVPRESLLGADGTSFLSAADAERARALRGQLDGAGPQMTLNVAVARRDGTSFKAEIVGRAMVFEGRRMVVSGMRDITERVKTEEALRRSERLSALGTLIAGVAHEINNPLTYVRANVELMQMLTADILSTAPEETRERAEEMLAQSRTALHGIDHIARITQSLKQVARAPAPTRAREDVTRLAACVIDIARPRVLPRVELESRLRSTRPVLANGSEIAQVILNLLLNAADATAEEGSRIVVETWDQGDRVMLSVTDDGPGVPPERRVMLFTPFFTTKPQGTGLGLSVSQAIAQDHGGELTLAPGRGPGASFVLSLPAAGGGA
ncbi:MAG TPA: ATP-binding protein [Candidatus Thermoplasmatota archaeon]|nr:ATP-binding protein [Candidatus Thermoplasmatota archaeon]